MKTMLVTAALAIPVLSAALGQAANDKTDKNSAAEQEVKQVHKSDSKRL